MNSPRPVASCLNKFTVLGSLLLCMSCTGSMVDEAEDQVPGRAAIASADPRATEAGMAILNQGGNAFDAAVAVASTLAVVEPAGSGLGGGGFFLLYLADRDEYRFVDAREVAPQAAYRDMYLDDSGEPVPRASTDGALAAGIPGEPAGMAYLAKEFGNLPLTKLLQPAIDHAENGFPIGRRALLGLRFRTKTIQKSPARAEVFLPGGELPAEGTLIVQPDLAATLKRFAADGHAGFYQGETATRLVEGVTAAGGIWTQQDLANYQVTERDPVIVEHEGMRVISAPLPSSGGVVLGQMLNFIGAEKQQAGTSVQRIHTEIEAMRRAYQDRAVYLGDQDFVEVPVTQLLSSEQLATHRSSFSIDHATPSSSLSNATTDGSEGAQTTHFSIIDAEGNRVAATITVNTWYGSAFMAPGTGIVLNNEMDDFSIKPGVPNDFNLIGGEANEVAPGKRPLSSMSPTFLESDRGVAIVGTPGGSRIITMVLRAALNWQAGGTAEDMVSLKRYHHQYYPDVVNYEPEAFSADELSALKSMGHELAESRRPFGNMNVVTWDYASGLVEAATDPRGEGEGRVY